MRHKPNTDCQLKFRDTRCNGVVYKCVVFETGHRDAELYSCHRHNLLYRAITKLVNDYKVPMDDIKELWPAEILKLLTQKERFDVRGPKIKAYKTT